MNRNTCIESCARNGDFKLGWARFKSLEQPSPVQKRWAAACLLNLGRTAEARDLLLESVAQGCLEARIELAGAYRMLGQVTLAQHALERVSGALCAFNQTLLERERGALLLATGQLRAACECFERAWASSFESGARGLQSGVAWPWASPCPSWAATPRRWPGSSGPD